MKKYTNHPDVQLHFYGDSIIVVSPKGNYLLNKFQSLIVEHIIAGKNINQIYEIIQNYIEEIDFNSIKYQFVNKINLLCYTQCDQGDLT